MFSSYSTCCVRVLTCLEGLLLLRELTKVNQEIGKIVAFAGTVLIPGIVLAHTPGAFEFLMDIIQEEGMGNGGIVVADSIQVICNLLKDNNLNCVHFRYL